MCTEQNRTNMQPQPDFLLNVEPCSKNLIFKYLFLENQYATTTGKKVPYNHPICSEKVILFTTQKKTYNYTRAELLLLLIVSKISIEVNCQKIIIHMDTIQKHQKMRLTSLRQPLVWDLVFIRYPHLLWQKEACPSMIIKTEDLSQSIIENSGEVTLYVKYTISASSGLPVELRLLLP